MLVLYAVSLASLIGLGVGALEHDLREAGFGWRQVAAALSVATLLVAILPFLQSLGSGRFDLPTTSVAQSLSELAPNTSGGYRVLWLGDPSVLPLAGWSVAPGLEAATSMNGLPGGSTLFNPPDAGASNVIIASRRERYDRSHGATRVPPRPGGDIDDRGHELVGARALGRGKLANAPRAGHARERAVKPERPLTGTADIVGRGVFER